MGADSYKIREILAEPLADLDDTLGTTNDDIRLLTDLKQRIGGLLGSGNGVEQEIRALLQERYNDGALREETYQLVKSMLDRHTTENVKTAPKDSRQSRSALDTESEFDARTAELGNDEPSDDDAFAATAVLKDSKSHPVVADDQVQVGSVLRDRFLLKERVAGGSMGVVYKALDRRMAEAGAGEHWVAIKILSPQLSQNAQALRALQQEAAKGRCLTHSNIVRFIDLDRDDDLYFIVMEWLDGQNLAEILDSSDGKAMGIEEAIDIVEQTCRALDYAHRCGIVHADVKPGNIMIMPDGTVKLFDFGVARVRQTEEQAGNEFNPSVLGALTPAYSSMQVLTGEEPVPADDVFSLGCLFYRLVAGYRVFGPRNAAQAAEEGMKPQRPQGLSDSQWRALKKAISFSRVTRFQTMAEFLEALRDESGETIAIEADQRLLAEEKPSSHSWLLGLVALVGLLGFAIFQFGFSDNYELSGKTQDWLDRQISTFKQAIATDNAAEGTDDNAIVDLDMPPQNPIAEQAIASPGTETAQAETELDELAGAGPGAASAETDEDPTAGLVTGTDSLMPELFEEEDTATPIDFSILPPASVQVPLQEGSLESAPTVVTLREDDAPITVDLMRTGSIEPPLRLRIEEVGYSGNRSPWAAGQYTISDDGMIEIPAGQDRARITLSMASDPLREADQVSTLRVRQADSTTTQLATIELELEDDDQRAFEAELPINTLAFAVSQVSVRERDPVVQIDVLRFNPDDTQVVIGYTVRDITATEGEDYFSPGGYSVSFGPGQRSARLLIPLVQDSISEGDEAFTVELAARDDTVGAEVYQRIVVMIRDDEIAAQ